MLQGQATNDGNLWLFQGTTWTNGAGRANSFSIQDEARTIFGKARKLVKLPLFQRDVVVPTTQGVGS